MKKYLIFAAVFALALLVGCDGANNKMVEEVEEVAEDLIKAITKADQEDLAKLYEDEDDAPSEDEVNRMSAFVDDLDFEVGGVTVDGDKAEVILTVEGERMGQEIEQEITVEFELDRDDWVVADLDVDDFVLKTDDDDEDGKRISRL